VLRASLLERLADLIVAAQRPHPPRVAVDGMAAAGKTILADELAEALRRRGRPVIRASVDGFHRPRAERYRRGADSPGGYYDDAFDYEALRAALLLPLGPGGSLEYRQATFDWLADAPVHAPPRRAPRDAVLLCDGVFLLRPELKDCWDYRIFVHVDDAVAVRRAVQRDQALLGAAEAVRERYRKRYVPAQHIYLERARPQERADVIVDNNDPMNPRLTLSTGCVTWGRQQINE
jgi:uridine kinase